MTCPQCHQEAPHHKMDCSERVPLSDESRALLDKGIADVQAGRVRPYEHPDLQLARELIVPGAVWTPERTQQLRDLVKRNELIGSPLGRGRYILARDMLWAVEKYEKETAYVLVVWRDLDE